MTRLEFFDCAIGGQRRGHANKRKVMMNGFKVYFAADVRMCQQSHELRTENQFAVDFGIEQRLLAHPVAREKE